MHPFPLTQSVPRLSLAVACSALVSVTATGQVVFSNYGPSDSYGNGFTSATFAGYGKTAARFVPPASGDFNQVETSLSRSFNTNFVAIVSIVPEMAGPSGNQPGLMPVWCSTSVSSPIDQRAIYTFSGGRASLVGGQPYWLVLEASDNSSWYWTSPIVSGTTASKAGSPTWSLMPGAVIPAMRLSLVGGASPTGACCNTETGGCTLLSAAACGAVNLRYSGTNIACSPTLCTACHADFDHSGTLEVQDIFDFLNSWFTGCP